MGEGEGVIQTVPVVSREKNSELPLMSQRAISWNEGSLFLETLGNHARSPSIRAHYSFSVYMPFILILDNIRSAHNVGALFRTADGAGVDELYLVGITPQPSKKDLYLTDAEKTLKKTALGAEQTMAWKQVKTLPPLLKRLKQAGYTLVALEQSEGSVDYRVWRAPKNKQIALIVGNEVEGMAPKTLALCDQVIELPMRGTKNSLNVAVAAGIALYHLSSTMEK